MVEVNKPRKRKVGLESSETRMRLLNAAEQLMCEEGYAAVTTRRLAKHAGVGPQLVHYYFPSLDDLFVTLYRRRAEKALHLAVDHLKSEDPLQALWENSHDSSHVTLTQEFMALANHRKVIRAEIGRYGEQLHLIQQTALQNYFERRGVTPDIDPGVIIVMLSSIGYFLALGSQAGMTFSHTKTEEFVASLIDSLKDTKDSKDTKDTKRKISTPRKLTP